MACKPCSPRLWLPLGQGQALFQTDEDIFGKAAADCPHIVGAEAVDVAASNKVVWPSFLHLHFPLLPHFAAQSTGFNAYGIRHLTLSTCFQSDYDVSHMEEDLEELCARSILPFLSSFCFCPAGDSGGGVALTALDISAELAFGLCSALANCSADKSLATVQELSIGNQTGLGIHGYRLPAYLPPVRSLARLLRLFPALTCMRLYCKRLIRCASMEEIMRSYAGAHLQRLFVCTRFGGRFLPALPPNQISAPLLDVLALYYGSPIISDDEKEGREDTDEKQNENKDGEEDEKDAEGEIVGPHNRGEQQDGGKKEDEGIWANNGARREAAEFPVLPTGVRVRHLAIALSKEKLPDKACLDQFFQSIPCLEWFVVIVHDDDKTLFWHRETAGPEAEENRRQKKLNETKTFIERTTAVLALNEAHPELFGVFWRELIDINVLSLS
ncbi:unnamed protein product [Dibothriocephalus latus]|uniref:Uncharacterized protein n=1 Tax=Dibothriocephalus latus TaxID=60516 RepID=A0A3P7P7L7_DIBLA|nr:unnamed protein product [Dibothriocephalus latus]